MSGEGYGAYRTRATDRDGGPGWVAASVRALRRHLGLSQREMAAELGTRQQTVSEWETGLYRPRGASARLLTIIAERARFEYRAGGTRQADREDDPSDARRS